MILHIRNSVIHLYYVFIIHLQCTQSNSAAKVFHGKWFCRGSFCVVAARDWHGQVHWKKTQNIKGYYISWQFCSKSLRKIIDNWMTISREASPHTRLVLLNCCTSVPDWSLPHATDRVPGKVSILTGSLWPFLASYFLLSTSILQVCEKRVCTSVALIFQNSAWQLYSGFLILWYQRSCLLFFSQAHRNGLDSRYSYCVVYHSTYLKLGCLYTVTRVVTVF